MERYDIIIIGTGPAGLEASITSKIRNKKILLIGNKNLSLKVTKGHLINNYLGLKSITGEELASNFKSHLENMGIEIIEDHIAMIYAMGDYFSLQGNKEIYESKSVILATGVSFEKPYNGEEKFLGRGVSYCATCDAPLYRGKVVAIIAQTKKEEMEANFLSEVAEKVYYIPLYKEEISVNDKVEVIKDIPLEIKGNLKANELILKDHNLLVDGVFILRESVAPNQLVPGLEMKDNHILVNRKMETNIKGLYACGDVVGLPYQYIKAAGEGNVAALSAVNYLDSLK